MNPPPPSPGPAPDVSVVLAVYNESGHVLEEIRRILGALEASDYSYEVIVVDDGSTDGSVELVAGQYREREEVRLIRFERNRGSGAARRAGTRAARGDVVVWTDCDMTYPNDEIPRLVKQLEASGHDQVVGARTTEQGSMKPLRVPAKWLIRRLAEYLTQTDIPDLNSGFRAFRRDVARQFVPLLPDGFSCVTTMTMSFLANGYTVTYLPIDYEPRAGESKFHWWADTRRYLLQVVRLVLSYEPLRFFMPIGVVLGLFGLGKLGVDAVTKDLRVATNTLLILFAAFQVIAIGLLADLVVRATKPREDLDGR